MSNRSQAPRNVLIALASAADVRAFVAAAKGPRIWARSSRSSSASSATADARERHGDASRPLAGTSGPISRPLSQRRAMT
jgi:hypothetical protein